MLNIQNLKYLIRLNVLRDIEISLLKRQEKGLIISQESYECLKELEEEYKKEKERK